jgi:hypothetical protein
MSALSSRAQEREVTKSVGPRSGGDRGKRQETRDKRQETRDKRQETRDKRFRMRRGVAYIEWSYIL